MPLFDRIYDWQDSLSEKKFERLKKIFFLTGWLLIIIPIVAIIFIFYVNEIIALFISEGMLILFVTAMNMDDSSHIFSTVLWFVGINVLFILLFSGLLSGIPVRIR